MFEPISKQLNVQAYVFQSAVHIIYDNELPTNELVEEQLVT